MTELELETFKRCHLIDRKDRLRDLLDRQRHISQTLRVIISR